MAFKFKTSRNAKQDPFGSNKPQLARAAEEILSGFVDNIPAKRDEEFFMTEVRRLSTVRGSEFRMTLGAPRHMPGWLELDALVETYNGYRAFELDDMSFVHIGRGEEAEAKIKDKRRMDGLAKYGIFPRNGIEHIDAADLENRQMTRKFVQELRL